MATTKTPTPEPDANPATTGLPADDYKREQVKSGKDPVSPAVEPVKSEPLDIAPNEPYPTGNPPKDPFHNPAPPENAP